MVGGGIGWVLMVMAACSTYYRTSIRRVRRNFRDDINREMSKQRLLSRQKLPPQFEGLKTLPSGHKIQEIRELMTVPVS